MGSDGGECSKTRFSRWLSDRMKLERDGVKTLIHASPDNNQPTGVVLM